MLAETKPLTGTVYYDPDGTQAGSRRYVYGGTGINYACSGRHSLGSNYSGCDGSAAWMKQLELNVTNGKLKWKYNQ
jgi:hypothetical protein